MALFNHVVLLASLRSEGVFKKWIYGTGNYRKPNSNQLSISKKTSRLFQLTPVTCAEFKMDH
jgi:hypothetical protein